MHPSSNALGALALSLVLATLSGCSEYIDRRDTIALSGGNAVATDKVTQMVDPWPAASANKAIGFNGERMENAMQRYRTNHAYAPNGTVTSSTYGAAPAQQNNMAPVSPTVTEPAAPVK